MRANRLFQYVALPLPDADLTSGRVALATSKSRQNQINMQRLMILSVLHHQQVDPRNIQRFFEAEKEYFSSSWSGLKTRLALLARQLWKDSWNSSVVDAMPREPAVHELKLTDLITGLPYLDKVDEVRSAAQCDLCGPEGAHRHGCPSERINLWGEGYDPETMVSSCRPCR